MCCTHLPTYLSLLHTVSVKVWREPHDTFGSVTNCPPSEACLENVLWLCGWLWVDVLGVGLMETILDTYCECTSVSQEIFSSLGTKAYVTYILSNREHALVFMDQFWKVLFTGSVAGSHQWPAASSSWLLRNAFLSSTVVKERIRGKL